MLRLRLKWVCLKKCLCVWCGRLVTFGILYKKKKCLMSKISLLSSYCCWFFFLWFFSMLYHLHIQNKFFNYSSELIPMSMPHMNATHIMMLRLTWHESNIGQTTLRQSPRNTVIVRGTVRLVGELCCVYTRAIPCPPRRHSQYKYLITSPSETTEHPSEELGGQLVRVAGWVWLTPSLH